MAFVSHIETNPHTNSGQWSIRGPTLFLLYTNNLPDDVICNIAACEFQHFLLQQIKCRGRQLYENKFCLDFSLTMFLPRLAGFYIKNLGICLSNLGKNFEKKKTCKLAPLLHISPWIRSIMCTIIVVQILLYIYCYMQCNVLFFYVKRFVLKIILDASFEFKSKNKYERKMLNRLKRNFKTFA